MKTNLYLLAALQRHAQNLGFSMSRCIYECVADFMLPSRAVSPSFLPFPGVFSDEYYRLLYFYTQPHLAINPRLKKIV